MNIALCTITPIRHHKEATTITIIDLAKTLIREGHRAVIIAKKVEDLPEREVIQEVPVYRLGKLSSYAPAIKRIQKEKNIKFDIIHSLSATPLFILSTLSSKIYARKAKLIHTLKSYPRDKFSHLFYFLLNFANKVTVPSNTFSKKLKGVRKNKIKRIHSYINLSKFKPQDNAILKERHGYQDKKVILYYGSMASYKGPQILIKAIPEIISKFPNIKIIFAPRYKEIDEFRQQVKELDVEKNVDFRTDDINIEEFVNLADVVVLPYLSLTGTEGNPSCLLESAAAKTAVITSALPELEEILIPEIDFLTSKPGEVDSLVRNIERLFNNPDLQKKLIENAFNKVDRFDLNEIVKEFIEVYQS